MVNDVIFSVFDSIEGPIVLHSSLKSSENAQKIAVRSFIAIGAMEEDQDLRGKQAVVPLPSLGKIAFYYMFRVKATKSDEIHWATIGYISDSSSSINFFHSIPIIQNNITPIIEFIQQNFVYKGKNTVLSTTIISTINSLRSPIVSETVDITPSITAPDHVGTIIAPEIVQEGDLGFLFEYFREDLDKVIYSLMMEEPVLIIGDIRDIINRIVASLELLVPHRILAKKYLTSYVEPKDEVLICSSQVNFLKKYKGVTTADLTNRKITSRIKGLPSISDLISTLKIAPTSTQQSVIKDYIDNLLSKTAQLMELCDREQVGSDEIRGFRGDLKSDELNIVISMVRRFAPQFEGKLFHFARTMI